MAQIKGMSLFKKTGLLAFCLFGVISTLASTFTAWTLYDRLTQEYISKGSAIGRSVAGASQEILLGRDVATVQAMIDQYLQIEGVTYVFVVDSGGEVVSHTFVPEMPERLKTIHGSTKKQTIEQLHVDPFGQVIDICTPVLAGVAGYVHVGMDKGLILDYFWKVVLDMQILLFFTFWLCVGILYIVTLRISKPLGQLTKYAQELAAHDFSTTIDIRTRDELELLGRTMQSMGQELALLFSEMESEVDKATGDLRDNMAYLSAIIDNLADGLLVVGVTGEITVINPAMKEFFDLGDEDNGALPAKDLFPPEVVEMTSGVRSCNHEVLSAEVPLSRGRIGKAVGSAVLVEGKQCLGGVILVRDITREKQLDQLKMGFISTVSHELRTPMTSVLGFSKIIKKKLEKSVFPALEDDREAMKSISQVRGNMDIIVTEAERLTELINDVLDIARMEAGKVLWRQQLVSMSEVVVHSKDSTMGMWKSKGLQVALDIEEDLPTVQGDYDRLVQVVVNLISNAIKFTDTGVILCRAYQQDGAVLVSVEDRGQGIIENDLAHVFDKFRQVGDTLTDKPSGSGLGLPICRQIVEHHGGRIWVESQIGEGSTFFFSIPINSAEEGPWIEGESVADVPGALLAEGGPPDGFRQKDSGQAPLILVVDDDPFLTKYLAQFFEDQSFSVAVAHNGHDAVGKAQVLQPDLITMDIMMPGLDGHETIGCLRSNISTWHIPILVITALSDQGEGDGDMSLVKPVDEDQLLDAVHALLNRKSVSTTCMSLGKPNTCNLTGLAVTCTGEMIFAEIDEFWDRVEKGFSGVVFIPAEETENVHLERLIRLPGISVVILPAFKCD